MKTAPQLTRDGRVSLPWVTYRDVDKFRFLGRLSDLQGETKRALKFGGQWYPRSQMANYAGLDGMEFLVKRWLKPITARPTEG